LIPFLLATGAEVVEARLVLLRGTGAAANRDQFALDARSVREQQQVLGPGRFAPLGFGNPARAADAVDQRHVAGRNAPLVGHRHAHGQRSVAERIDAPLDPRAVTQLHGRPILLLRENGGRNDPCQSNHEQFRVHTSLSAELGSKALANVERLFHLSRVVDDRQDRWSNP
jgi:hypothetical protein